MLLRRKRGSSDLAHKMSTREPRCGVKAGATDVYRSLNALGIVTFTLWNTETGVPPSPCLLFVFLFCCACEMSPSWCQTYLDEAYLWDRCNLKAAWRKTVKAWVTEALLSHIISSDVAPTGERSIQPRWQLKCFCFFKGLSVGLNTNPLSLHFAYPLSLCMYIFPRILFWSNHFLLFAWTYPKHFYCSPVQLDRMSVMQTCRPHFSW